MSLVKWLRKNNRKVMTFVVIFCMISFVIGSFGLQMIAGIFSKARQTLATYDDGRKIKSSDFMRAQSELTILRMLMADRLLVAQARQGFSAPLLAYLLFPDSQLSGEIASQLKQAVQQGQVPLSQEDLDNFFNQPSERAEILWLLLREEAHDAGCHVPLENAQKTLQYAIPQMTGNQLDANALVNQIISKNNLTEAQIVQVFSDLLSIVSYTNQVINNQSVTTNQIKAVLGRTQERIDAEYAEIPAAWFIDDKAEVSDERIIEQFEPYKAVNSGIPTEDNPFGFGYKLPKRVQLEYIVVKMDDVKEQIKKPTIDEMEAYYTGHLDRFTQKQPADPENSDAEPEVKTRSYPEVEATIRRTLESERTSTLANRIFNDIKAATETGFESININEASVADLQMAAGDYEAVQKIAEKYNVSVQVGKTGYLNPESLSQDEVLGNLAFQRGQNTLRLADLAFAVTREKAATQRIGIPSIRIWENIGPLSGGFYSEALKQYSRVMALVRVVDIKDTEVPQSPDVSYPTQGANLGAAVQDSTFVLRDQIKDDILLLDAMEQARKRAEELALMAKEADWEQAVESHNKKYAAADPNETAADNQKIELAESKSQIRISPSEIQMAKRFMRDNPSAARYIQNRLINNMLTNKLYEMLPESSQTTGTIQAVLPFEAQNKYIVVKNVTRVPATMEDYLSKKSQTALQISSTESAGVVLAQLSPENIRTRMNYQSKQNDDADKEEKEEAPAEEEEK